MNILVILILSISCFLEFLYGSRVVGIILFLLLLLFLLKTKTTYYHDNKIHTRSSFIIGFVMTVIVLLTKGKMWGVLDIMSIVLGCSLMLTIFNRTSTIAKFSSIMSAFFIISFVSLYSIPHYLGLPIPYYYGHYLIALPVVWILRSTGYEVGLRSFRTIFVNGVDPVNLKIELSCFGWYSLLIALGTVIAYDKAISPTGKLTKLILITALSVYLANFIRIALLVVVAYNYGTKVMLTLHAHIGWILFALILLLLNYLMNSDSNSLS